VKLAAEQGLAVKKVTTHACLGAHRARILLTEIAALDGILDKIITYYGRREARIKISGVGEVDAATAKQDGVSVELSVQSNPRRLVFLVILTSLARSQFLRTISKAHRTYQRSKQSLGKGWAVRISFELERTIGAS
jgi:hypothetical protein